MNSHDEPFARFAFDNEQEKDALVRTDAFFDSTSDYAPGPGKTPHFLPNDDILLVEPLREERTASGLYVPPAAQESNSLGLVVEIGWRASEGEDGNSLMINTGDYVLFAATAGRRIDVDGVVRIALRRAEVLTLVRWEESSDA